LATIAAVIVGAWAGDAITNFLHQRWVDSEIKKELVESSESMNKTLPKMLDSITRLDTTTIVQEPHVFNYHYTLMLNPDLPMDRNKFSNIMRSNLTKTYRESDGMKYFRDYGVSVIYDYSDVRGQKIAEIEVGPNDLK
jgi:hypothetical protein